MISIKTIANKVEKKLSALGVKVTASITEPSNTQLAVVSSEGVKAAYDLVEYKAVTSAVESITDNFLQIWQCYHKANYELNNMVIILNEGTNDFLGFHIDTCIDKDVLEYAGLNISHDDLLKIARKNLLSKTYLNLDIPCAENFDTDKLQSLNSLRNTIYVWAEGVKDCSGLLLLDEIFTIIAEQLESDLVIIPVKYGLIINSVRCFVDYNIRRSLKVNEKLSNLVYEIKSVLDVDRLEGALSYVYIFNKKQGSLGIL